MVWRARCRSRRRHRYGHVLHVTCCVPLQRPLRRPAGPLARRRTRPDSPRSNTESSPNSYFQVHLPICTVNDPLTHENEGRAFRGQEPRCSRAGPISVKKQHPRASRASGRRHQVRQGRDEAPSFGRSRQEIKLNSACALRYAKPTSGSARLAHGGRAVPSHWFYASLIRWRPVRRSSSVDARLGHAHPFAQN
jgi:hypothetical protein